MDQQQLSFNNIFTNRYISILRTLCLHQPHLHFYLQSVLRARVSLLCSYLKCEIRTNSKISAQLSCDSFTPLQFYTHAFMLISHRTNWYCLGNPATRWTTERLNDRSKTMIFASVIKEHTIFVVVPGISCLYWRILICRAEHLLSIKTRFLD